MFQRDDGLWVGKLTLQFGGLKKRKTVYGRTLKDVQDKMSKARDATKVASTKMTLAEFVRDSWLPYIERGGLKGSGRRSTWERLESMARLHIIPALGAVKLTDIDSNSLLLLDSHLVKRKASTATRRNAYQRVSEIMEYAKKVFAPMNVTIHNPCKLGIVRAAPHVVKKSVVFTREQLDRFLEVAPGERLGAMYLLALFSGMRLGELFGLRLQDIDLEEGICSVSEQLRETGDGENRLGPPKTKTSVRTFGIPPQALDALREHVARMEITEPTAFVFTAMKGGGLRRSVFTRKEWKPFLRRVNLPSVRFHSLRSITKTLHDRAGVSTKISMEILGHAISDVHQGYARPDLEDHKEAARKIGGLFASGVRPALDKVHLAV